MDYEYLQQAQTNYYEEVLQHQLSLRKVEDSIEDIGQEWNDQSAINFTNLYILQMQEISNDLDITLNEHQSSLGELAAYFQSVEVKKKQFKHLGETFFKLINERECQIKEFERKTLESKSDAMAALQKAEEAKTLTTDLKYW